jgi:hypothetical protein
MDRVDGKCPKFQPPSTLVKENATLHIKNSMEEHVYSSLYVRLHILRTYIKLFYRIIEDVFVFIGR